MFSLRRTALVLAGCAALTAAGGLSAASASAAALSLETSSPTDYADRILDHGYQGSIRVKTGRAFVLDDVSGYANRSTRLANSTSLAYPLASVSKPITAITVLRMAQESRLGLDQPITRYLSNVPRDKTAITVRDLLLHRAGLPDLMPDTDDTDDLTLQEGVDVALSEPLANAGSYSYSDAGYVLLAAIVETVARAPFDDVVRDRVFTPASMTTAGFWGDAQYTTANATHAYADGHDEGAMALEDPPTFAILGAGGVVASASDLIKLCEALEAGLILDSTRLRLLTTPAIDEETDDPTRWATHGFSSSEVDGTLVLDHDGMGISDGETAALAWIPSNSTRIAVTGNDAELIAAGVMRRLAHTLLGETVPAPPPVVATTASDRSPVDGATETTGGGDVDTTVVGSVATVTPLDQQAIFDLEAQDASIETEMGQQDAAALRLVTALAGASTPRWTLDDEEQAVRRELRGAVAANGEVRSVVSAGTRTLREYLVSQIRVTYANGSTRLVSVYWGGDPGDRTERYLMRTDLARLAYQFRFAGDGRWVRYEMFFQRNTKLTVSSGRLTVVEL